MASVTRSTRRAEGLPPHHQFHANGPLARPGPAPPSVSGAGSGPPAALFHRQHQIQNRNNQNDARMTKRGLEPADRDRGSEAGKSKRSRIAVEVLAKLPQTQVPPPVHPSMTKAQVASVDNEGGSRGGQSASLTGRPVASQELQPAANPQDQDSNVTKHQAKVINGMRHELDRLEPQSKDKKEQGRKLRSQETTRFKSDLSAYFPDYDEVIGNDPKEQHTLNPETPIVVTDSNFRRTIPEPPRGASKTIPQIYQQYYHSYQQNATFPARGYGDALFTDLFDTQRIDFGFLEAQHKNKNIEDPLPDSFFEPTHRRAERLERSIRNTEKGRAQHEKDQIIRLLEGLQGHDWLRVMGVSGVTETKKKTFEPAREYFIKGCQAILDKFKNWSLEEKRRKQERERALAEQAQEAEEEEAEEENAESGQAFEETVKNESSQGLSAGQSVIGDDEMSERVGTSQDDTSESTSPARQLRQEALARSKLAAALKRQRSMMHPSPPKQPESPKPFYSFFSKKYERESALHRHRRTGRKVLAWGHPIPDIPEADFVLPQQYRDDEMLKSRERKKRRDRRESKDPKRRV